ncbi:MAG: pyridoxal phosphate-dependent aminotransferase [Myxococcota bacterium]|nr:pyridoxal phosphate-dependent aminotransferase [Myxococcota bacterium]
MTTVSLNPQLINMAPSATLAIHERSKNLVAAGRSIAKLGLGQSPFPVPTSVIQALRRAATEKDYLPVSGLEALRSAIARHHQRIDDLNFSPDDIIIGPGSKELLFLTQLVHQGTLLLPNPSWVSYAPQAQLIGKPVQWIDTASSGWRLTAASLEAHCRSQDDGPKLLILNYPNNPTGLTYDESALVDIAQVCRANEIIVVADEIYGRLDHRGQHRSLAAHYPDGTIVCSGLSKWAGAGGWRLGYAVYPPRLRTMFKAMKAAASETFTSVSAPIQYAAMTAFDGDSDIERYLEDSRRILKALAQASVRILRTAEVKVSDAEGGFYLFIDLESWRPALSDRGIRTGEAVAESLLNERGVACLPGSCFGRPSAELTLRLSLVDFDGAYALSQVSKKPAGQPLSETEVATLCKPTIQAMDDIADWCRTR